MNVSYVDFLTPMQWLSLAILVSLFVVFFYVYQHRKSDAFLLKKVLKKHAVASLKDAVLYDGVDSYLFADDVLLLQGRILIVKRDESQGYIFGASNIHEWTCVKNHATSKFNNPLEKVGHFVTQVKQECGFDDVMGCVLFGSQATFPKGVPEHVLQIARLEADIENLVGGEANHEQAEQAWVKLMTMVEKDKHEVGQVHS